MHNSPPPPLMLEHPITSILKEEICGNRETREMYSVQPAPFAASPSCGLIGARCDTATCMPSMGKSHARPLILSAQMSLGCMFAPAIFDLIAPAYSATHLVCSNSDIWANCRCKRVARNSGDFIGWINLIPAYDTVGTPTYIVSPFKEISYH